MASNYAGYLIKFGDSLQYEIPLAYMLHDTYEPVDEKLDTDPKRSADNGKLVRNVVAKKAHVKVTLRSLPEPAVSDLMSKLQSAVHSDASVSANEEAVNVKFWVPKRGDYTDTILCYVPTLNIKIKHIEGTKIIYDQFDIEFIEY